MILLLDGWMSWYSTRDEGFFLCPGCQCDRTRGTPQAAQRHVVGAGERSLQKNRHSDAEEQVNNGHKCLFFILFKSYLSTKNGGSPGDLGAWDLLLLSTFLLYTVYTV